MEVPLPRAASRRLTSFFTFQISIFFSASFAAGVLMMGELCVGLRLDDGRSGGSRRKKRRGEECQAAGAQVLDSDCDLESPQSLPSAAEMTRTVKGNENETTKDWVYHKRAVECCSCVLVEVRRSSSGFAAEDVRVMDFKIAGKIRGFGEIWDVGLWLLGSR